MFRSKNYHLVKGVRGQTLSQKHSNVKTDKKARVSQLKAQFLEKAKKKSK